MTDDDGLPPLRPTLPGTLLTDDVWLGERVSRMARPGGSTERRTNATLWWYSASAVLLGPAVRALVLTGTADSLAPSLIRFTLRPDGYLNQVRPGPPLDLPRPGRDTPPAVSLPGSGSSLGEDPLPGSDARLEGSLVAVASEVLGRHLDDVLGPMIAALARAAGSREHPLWAIAADSLATVVLAATRVLPGGTAHAPALATAIAAAAPRLRPLPSYVDIAVPPTFADEFAGPGAHGNRAGRPAVAVKYVKRGSCCLLWRIPEGTCLSCPNQTPAVRLDRLTRHAAAQARS